MKTVIVLSFLLMLVHVTVQKALIDSPCTEETEGVKDNVNECLHIQCPDGIPRPIACMNDICPPGQDVHGRAPGDDSLVYPGCCGQLICHNSTLADVGN